MGRKKPKQYQDMNDTEKIAHFRAVLAEDVRRFKAGTAVESNVAICVRHFIHPSAYHLSKQMMREAAEAMGAKVDEKGVWAPCYGELWLREALATPQVEVP
jgi:hypothetical protein